MILNEDRIRRAAEEARNQRKDNTYNIIIQLHILILQMPMTYSSPIASKIGIL